MSIDQTENGAQGTALTSTDAPREAVAVGVPEVNRIVGSGKRSASGPGPAVMAAQTLEGNDVLNLSGEKLGVLQDIMLDVPSGRIAYAVLERGGVMGIGDKLFAIPWHALTLDTDRKCFLLELDLEKLRQARGFDKDNWPACADAEWAALQGGTATAAADATSAAALPATGHVQQVFD
ncbi:MULTISPECIES: PRC-barrel domain-containing protein [unclassified Achromobacter]|uniref:PRC-barrel domain-containing protein n=1 Tax=unclassified Achromobacter TaxID=2626865 RepID=UPI000B514F32|nr:photosystem reaction center subunit H [Achromobacter sp. HZ34]OWT67991.1 photosystem reaction center subunit H [Achromobacter sp. HZ28]